MNKEEICPICLENIKNKLFITTICKHKYCLECFLDLYDTRCPMCRKDLKDVIPNKLLNILLKNNKNNKTTRNMNIFNEIDFPPLS